MLIRFLRDRNGGTAIEYSMIAAMVALLLITALTGIGTSLKDIMIAVTSGFDGVAP